MGMAEIAANMVFAAVPQFLSAHAPRKHRTPQLKVNWGIEKDKGCQQILARNAKDRCIFTDVLDMTSSPLCATHGRRCVVGQSGPTSIEIAGPPCVSFSGMGKREGNKSPIFKVHEAWYEQRAQRQEPIVILENAGAPADLPCFRQSTHPANTQPAAPVRVGHAQVCEHPTTLIKEKLSKFYEVFDVRFDPRHLGLGAARPRLYAVLVHRTKAQWTSPERSLGKLLEPLMAWPRMVAEDFFWDETAPAGLRSSQKPIIANYMQVTPAASVVDLSQNPTVRKRVNLKDNALPTLLRNSYALYSVSKNRVLSPRELLSSLGVPVCCSDARHIGA